MKVRMFFLVFFISFSCSINIFAQWKVYKNDPLAIKDTLWCFRKASPELFKYKCYFPEYQIDDKNLETGALLTFSKSGEKKDRVNSEYVTYSIPVKISFNEKGKLAIYQRIYLENIKGYKIRFHNTTDNTWYENEFKTDFEKAQIPTLTNLSDWSAVQSPKQKFIEANGEIDALEFVCYPTNRSKLVKLVVGELNIGNAYAPVVEVKSAFFNQVTGKTDAGFDNFCNTTYASWAPRNNSVLFPTLESFKYQNYESGVVYLKPDAAGADETEVFKKLIRACAQNYPFYQERKLDKTAIATKLDQLFSKNYSDIVHLADSTLKFLLSEFRDGHFNIIIPVSKESKQQPKLLPGPVRLYKIGKQVVVAAVFDSSYRAQMPVGSVVTAINNVPIEKLIATSQYNSILNRATIDSVRISYRKKDTDRLDQDLTIKYNRKQEIPQNFKPTHCSFKVLQDSINYFRINTWDMQVFLRFINNWNDLRLSKGLVIDLRGNPGGSDVPEQRFLSLFIDKPVVYQNAIVQDGFDQLESLVLKPNQTLHYSAKKPIVILVDENTACGSESFTMVIKKTANAVIIGDHKTRGILAARIDVHFPSGIVVQMNSLLSKPVYGNDTVIETQGISPDIWVLRSSVFDLAPYNDKVLKDAVKYLETKQWD